MSSMTADPPKADVEIIVPVEGRVSVGGVECKVRRLKTREFLQLMRVLSEGFGPELRNVQLGDENVGDQMVALMVIAVPAAVDEFIQFLGMVIEPVDKKQQKALVDVLDNPDVDEMLDVFEVVATQEKDDLQALLGKAKAMWSRLQSLYSPKKT